MNSGSAYSELETLLLFQALRAEGVTATTTFNRISDQLKSISLIRNDPKYDSSRLSPDALRELYLGLLKEEVKQDLERQTNGNSHLTNGDVSPGSRKRKAPSPTLPTVREAAQHSHLIPQLVSRLYARYRDGVVVQLQAHEREYAKTKQDIADIEAGQRDEYLQRQRAASQAQSSSRSSPKPSSMAHTQPKQAQHGHLQPTTSIAASPNLSQKAAESDTPMPAKPFAQAKIDAVINHGPEPQESPGGHRRASSNTTLPPLSEMAPQSPRFGIPPKIPGPVSQQVQQMTQGPNHGYTQSPPAGHQSPYVPNHAHPRPGSVHSPQLQQPLSRPSSSPRPILPPPKGMTLPPPPTGPHTGSPISHVPPPLQPQYQQSYAPQHRMSSGPASTGEGSAKGYSAPPVPQPPTGYYQQQLPYADRRTSFPAQQTPTYPQPQLPGGYMLPPFQIQSQDPSKPILQPQHWPQQTPGPPQRPPQYLPHGHNSPATVPRNATPFTSRSISDVVSALHTTPRRKVKPLWKSEYPSHMVQTPKPRPEIEPLSPTFERAKSPVRPSKGNRGQNIPTVEEPTQSQLTPKTRTSKRRTNARERSPLSVVSSIADESLRARTRSQSVSTAAGANAPSEGRPNSRNGVEPELSLPANTLEELDPTAVPSGSPGPGMMTRKRRGTIQSQPPLPSKRKKQDSPGISTEEQDGFPTPPTRSSTVTAPRNFAKMSSAIMNDIASHKHASYFAKEVRDKDAPGYSEIVRQPQNLKSIRSAITAGGRAIAVASANLDSPSVMPSTLSTTVELERSVELIPPKAIVNGAQLEKELMRMFANAYLFNPGEDGMALTTREMFEDVEQKINDWRAAEREAGRDAHVDEDENSKSKRRKL